MIKVFLKKNRRAPLQWHTASIYNEKIKNNIYIHNKNKTEGPFCNGTPRVYIIKIKKQ